MIILNGMLYYCNLNINCNSVKNHKMAMQDTKQMKCTVLTVSRPLPVFTS